MKKYISLLLALMVLMSGVICVSAADGTVTIRTTDIGFGPGSGYTSTDMFPNFKGGMPGDNLTQKNVIKNDLTKYDYVKVYMQAVPHAAGTNDPEADVSASDSNAYPATQNLAYFFGPVGRNAHLNPIMYPDSAVVARCAMIHDAGEHTPEVLDMWAKVKGDNLGGGLVVFLLGVVGALAAVVGYKKYTTYRHRRLSRRHRRRHVVKMRE